MNGRVAVSVQNLPPSGIRKFFDIVSEMDDVVTLGVGEPDFVTPWHIREACMYSLERGYTTYTSNKGLKELREEISYYTYRQIGIEYNPETEILVTVGVSEGLDLLMRTLLNPGDEVLIPEPSYVSYRPCAILAGGRPIAVPVSEENGFTITAEELEKYITDKTKLLLLCYPNNPTGAVLDKKAILEIAAFACRYNLLVISDEIYSRLFYEGEFVSIASVNGMKERTIVLNGLSKAHAMTGWRIGFILGPKDIVDGAVKIHQYTMLCAPMMSQKAAIEALRNGEEHVKEMVQKYNQRRRLIVKGLNDIGLPCFNPKGAFYVFPSIKHTGLSSQEFAEKLLFSEKVAVVPGNAFGPSGEGHIRCSYAASIDQINTALERIHSFLQKISRV
jgi:aminotransferase